MRVPRSQDDLVRQFQEQLYFLSSSCNAYDAGFEAEAKRLALIIRILAHDTKKSQSLLLNLGLKDKLKWCDLVGEIDPSNSFYLGVGIELASNPTGMRYVPALGEPKQRISFQQWWDGVVVLDKQASVSITRKFAVLHLADTDGGAHIDSALNQEYEKLSRQNGLSFDLCTISSEGSKMESIETNLILAIVRQIAHELKLTIQEQMTSFLDSDEQVRADNFEVSTARFINVSLGTIDALDRADGNS